MIARARILPLDHAHRGTNERDGAATRGTHGRQCGRAATLVCVRAGARRFHRPGMATPDRGAGDPRIDPRWLGAHAPQGRRFALRAVPHRHGRIPPLRGDRPPVSVQRIRRAGGGRRQESPEEGAARSLPPRHHRPAAGRRGGRHRVDAVGARQAGRHGLCGADRSRRAARRAGLRCHDRHAQGQRDRCRQVPVRRRRAGAGRAGPRPGRGAGAGRQADHRQHQRHS